MQQVVADGAVEVGPVVERVHLVDPHTLQLVGVRLDRVEHADRLTVGEGHDEVGPRLDVGEHVLGALG